MKGLRVDIFKHGAQSFSNKGISTFCEEATIVGEGIAEIFEADELRAPAVKIIVREGMPVIAVPIENKVKGMNGPMFGGCFIYSSDSRFRAISKGPIALHDRFEVPSNH